jgi:branched-subunit amino acid ABC-type transport system permease component
VAIGYTLVYGIVELINFAHGEVFMIGSFIAAAVRDDRPHQDTSASRSRRRCC